jgi:DNA-directed RNA polymerase subunit beta'
MLKTTLGQLLINDTLPEEMRDYERVLDKRGLNDVLQKLAEEHPDKYREVTKKLSDIGQQASYTTNGLSFGLRSLRSVPAAHRMRMRMAKTIRQLQADGRLTDEQREQKIIEAALTEQARLGEEVYGEAKEQGNPLVDQVDSGARGNKFNLNSLLAGDMLYTNHKGDPIPVPVTRSYSQGLRPAEYFASSYGARKGIIDLKSATQDAGFFAKQLVQAAHRLLVSQEDADEEYDETTPRGYPVAVDDADTEGGLLAHPIGDYARNTVLTPKILKDLKNRGIENILVRSAAVGGPRDGGVYARDVGVRERGRISPTGDYVGVAAAQALAEPVTQAQISSKHSGGVAGKASAGAISGFKYINQLVQVPKEFKGGAAHAQLDGTVSRVEDAPQGGKFVTIDNERHYVGKDYALSVEPGDKVEAGDVISEGIPNPAQIVKHKGVGEGRRYFVDTFRDALANSNTYGNRRNIELVARGLINHVRLTDELGDYVPDDVVPYQALEAGWQPREGTQNVDVRSSVGKYLERPVLHYTIGTRIRPSMLNQFKQYNVQNVDVHDDEPPFKPEMIRAMDNAQHDPDWMSRFIGSYQQKSTLRGVHRGATSDTAGTSFVAPLAQAKDFGLTGQTKGWKQDDKHKNTGSVLG